MLLKPKPISLKYLQHFDQQMRVCFSIYQWGMFDCSAFSMTMLLSMGALAAVMNNAL